MTQGIPQGAVDWPTLIYVVTAGAVLAAALGGFIGWLVWWMASQLSKNRHDMRSHVEQVLHSFDETIIEHGKRIGAVEVFNAGLTVMLKNIDEFREDVKERFDNLGRERREDMNELHRRLEAIRGAQPDGHGA